MFPARFDYFRAGSVEEALDLMTRHDGAKLLAGGHSLIPMMKLRLAQPPAVIDIGRLEALKGVTSRDGRIRLGALTTHAELVASELLRRECALLSEAAEKIADPQVRNKGTLGGNVAHADPASDLPAVLLALDAVFHLRSASGTRAVPAAEFFLDLFTTALGEGDLLTAVEVPSLAGAGSCYLKFEHPASGYAVCGAAALVELAPNGTVRRARLCFNGVAASPLDARAAATALAGRSPDEAALEEAASLVEVADPLSDTFASGPYRAAMAREYGRRALREASARARS